MLSFAAALLTLATRPATFDITHYGAVGNGSTMCTASIQHAIDDAEKAGGGVVEFPAGKFLSGSLHMKSEVRLNLDKDAVLLGSTHREDYQKGQWYALLLADGVENITVSGEGTIDGQGAALAQDVLAKMRAGKLANVSTNLWRPPEPERPQIIEFVNCKNVHVSGVTIQHASCWVEKYLECSYLTLDHLKVDSKTYWNNDGMDIVDCHHVLVSNCDVDSADDGICLKSDTYGHSCSDVVIQHCKIRSSASAIKFGTASRGGFQHFKIKDILAYNTYRSCVTIESVDGGIIKDIDVDGVKGVNVGNAFFVRLGHRDQKYPVGSVDGIRLRNFDVRIPAGSPDQGYPFQGPPDQEKRNISPSSVVGLPDHPVRNVLIENVKIETAGGGSEQVATRRLDDVPERPADYPEFSMFGELPACGIYLGHVVGVKVINPFIIVDKPDYRAPMAANMVDKAVIKGLTTTGAKVEVATRLSGSLSMSGGRQTDY